MHTRITQYFTEKESVPINVTDMIKGSWGWAGLTALVNSILSGLPAMGKP